MRATLVLLPVTLLAGACASNSDVGFSLRAVLEAETQGVRLLDDGTTGHAAMMDQLCTFDVDNGGVLDDADLGEGQEVLLDATGELALARVGGTLHTVDALGQSVRTARMQALDARLYGNQTVALVDHVEGCAVAWLGDEVTAWAVPDTTCGGNVAFDLDRTSGAAWVADGSSLTRVTPDGEFLRIDDVDADLLVWEPTTGGVVMGSRGEAWIQSVDGAGEVQWTRSLGGTLSDVDVARSASMVALMIEEGDRGALEIVSADAGDLTHRYRLPETAELAFSSEGRDLALVTGERAYLYDVETDISLVDTPSTRGASQADPWLGMDVGAGGSNTATAVVGTAVAVLLIVD